MKTKRLLALLLVMFTLSTSLWAGEQVVIDGIKYDITTKGKIAKVLSNSYQGDIVIPETVTYKGVECNVTAIDNSAFANCNLLKSVVVPNSVTEMGTKVFSASHVESVTLGNGISVINSNTFASCLFLSSVNIPESVTTIGEKAFQSCPALTSIYIPDNVETIGKYAFSSCVGFTRMIIGDGVTTIGDYAFSNCTNLTFVAFGAMVSSIGSNAFQNCGLTSVVIPNSVKTIGTRCFSGCSNMLSAKVGNGLKSISNYAFVDCTQLMSLSLREGLAEIGDYAFLRCSDLIVVKIPSSVVSIGSSAFMYCTKLFNLELNEGLTTIGSGAFAGCTEMEFVQIPKSVTTIWDSAFAGCSHLVTIMLGSGLTKLYGKAFSNCTALEHFYCEVVNPPTIVGTNPFLNSEVEYATLHVPASSVATYNNTSPWNTFGNVVAIDAQSQPEPPVLEKCAKPTITYDDGMLYFSCETPDVQFVYSIKNGGADTGVGDQAQLVSNYYVSVYATKSGYEDSDTATKTFVPVKAIKGDVNDDGKVTITDAVSVVNIILSGETSAPKMEAPEIQSVETSEPE